jgi:hypothetical protein
VVVVVVVVLPVNGYLLAVVRNLLKRTHRVRKDEVAHVCFFRT